MIQGAEGTMQITINNTILYLIKGDITQEETNAIVNAANSRLAGGGGVDGGIHRAGGPKIMEECRKIGGCPTGSAVITAGGNLRTKYVIHTVGPVYTDGKHNEAKLLSSAYQSSLELVGKNTKKKRTKKILKKIIVNLKRKKMGCPVWVFFFFQEGFWGKKGLCRGGRRII